MSEKETPEQQAMKTALPPILIKATQDDIDLYVWYNNTKNKRTLTMMVDIEHFYDETGYVINSTEHFHWTDPNEVRILSAYLLHAAKWMEAQ